MQEIQIEFMIEKKEGFGEDSEPLSFCGDTICAVGVFDGMGGSGAVKGAIKDNNEEHSQAYFASRMVKNAVEQLLTKTQNLTSTTLKEAIMQEFNEKIAARRSTSKLRSNLLRPYPTTMAFVLVENRPEDDYMIKSFWAGDSRNYLWTESGFYQISNDDLRDKKDPYENLKNDLTDAYTKADDAIRGEIGQEVADRTQADKELHNRIDNIELEANEAVGVVGKENLAQEYKDTNYLADADTMVNADKALDNAIYNVNNRVDGLDSRVSSLEDRMGDVEDRIDKVGAMAAAIANLRTMGYDPEAPTEIAVGVGQYKSETGLALGVFHYPNQDFMLSASISTSGDEVMGGIGATWKIGRKSATEKERTVEEKRVEKAEEMQDLAKKERVNAQRERHAKMLAEREAANK